MRQPASSVTLRRLEELLECQLEVLLRTSRNEGYRFLDRLTSEWLSGTARFDRPGEHLLGALDSASLIAVGGIHRDPYETTERAGRLRRFYVAPDWRRERVASKMLNTLITGAIGHFDIVRLRAPDERAGAFYEANGFSRSLRAGATHELRLD
jgi:GNAT superfamily N-acetyltransferase